MKSLRGSWRWFLFSVPRIPSIMLAAHNNIHLPFHRIAFRKSLVLYTISLSLPFHCFLILPFHSSTSILSEHARLPPTTNCPIQSSAILYAFFISSSSPNPQAFPPAIEHMYGLFRKKLPNSPPLKAPTGFLTGKGLSPTGATRLALIEKHLAAAGAAHLREAFCSLGVKMRDAIVINIASGKTAGMMCWIFIGWVFVERKVTFEMSIALLRRGGGADFLNWRKDQHSSADNIFSRIKSGIDQTFFNFASILLPLTIERNPNIRGN
ncbi:hypothetical protein EYC84_002679 [Monilinia fructicola]|uniref:Uncharacterized protein n=1 Tax=Monilinia fructicola TaxID=38448 RepID=A0A5M9JNW3_MONFR|nr:hypothetical protein EYC84_002679 [Monilinia fructicola]